MNKIICDRCGKDDDGSFTNITLQTQRTPNRRLNSVENRDYCPECYDYVMTRFEEGK